MSHAAVGQPHAPPATAPQPGGPVRRGSDLAIASAAAEAARTVTGVLDLSPGLFALAATYGSGQHVTGVVVRHLPPETLALDVRVVMSEAQCAALAHTAAEEPDRRDTEQPGILLDIASHVRDAVAAAVRDTTPLALSWVDVFIDDLR